MNKDLVSYIEKVIEDACKSENRPNDVKYHYFIIDDSFIFVMDTKFIKVQRRIEYRLSKNLPKNFNLEFNKNFEIASGTDLNYSIAGVEVFGKFHTLRSYKIEYLPPLVQEALKEGSCSKHVNELRKIEGEDNWYTILQGKEGWERYKKDYFTIYGEELKNPIKESYHN